MTRYRFQIDKNKAVRIWDNENPNENDAPFMFQPDYPDLTPWASKADATNWVNVFINALTNSDSEFVAGNSPDTHPAIRPKPEEELPS